MKLPLLPALASALLFAAGFIRADVPLPANVLNPGSGAEGWNVIRLATANIDKLLSENRITEILQQVQLCSPALRAIAKSGRDDADRERLLSLTVPVMRSVNGLAQASNARDGDLAKRYAQELRERLAEYAQQFDEKVVKADIHICPMHPEITSTDAKMPCTKCAMALVERRIPYSFIYVPPGEPTMLMTVVGNGPVEAGKKVEAKVQIKRRDGSPVLRSELMVMHTEPIHLLVIDPSLSDYHHEHPVPTEVPGEYAFSFTPRKTAPYRIFADVVPLSTSVQEYIFADLPSNGTPDPVKHGGSTFTSTAGGFKFDLEFDRMGGPNAKPQEVRAMRIRVADANGEPVKRLEPVMNAFAHLVGFYDDGKTVVHLHPAGGDILIPEARGGPQMEFRFYPPRAGFIRLYCQVMIDGKMLFAPFDVNVEG